MRYWLMKSEPDEFGIDDLVREKSTPWFGVRNFQARNFMREGMKVGDRVFFYHSSCPEPGIAGIADPSDPEGKWAAVKVKPVKKLKRAVTLKEIKADPALAEMELVKQSRLSVAEVRPAEWEHILDMAKR